MQNIRNCIRKNHCLLILLPFFRLGEGVTAYVRITWVHTVIAGDVVLAVSSSCYSITGLQLQNRTGNSQGALRLAAWDLLWHLDVGFWRSFGGPWVISLLSLSSHTQCCSGKALLSAAVCTPDTGVSACSKQCPCRMVSYWERVLGLSALLCLNHNIAAGALI